MAQHSPLTRTQRGVIVLLALSMLIVATGCQWLLSGTQLASQPPRMNCPTPTPLPTVQVANGTETQIINGTPVVVERTRDTAPYEREYGIPVLTPTAYVHEAATFPMDTIVRLGGDVDAQLRVESRTATRQVENRTERMVRIVVEWNNPGDPLTFDPYRQLAVTQVQEASGRIRSGLWRWSPDVALVSDLPAPESFDATQTRIPTGESTMAVDLFIPDGQVYVAELRLDGALSSGSGGAFEDLRVKFVAQVVIDPFCAAPGLVGAAADPDRQDAQPVLVPGVTPPGGTHPAVVAALSQLGRPYCWGGKGWTPCNGCGGGKCYPACTSYPCWDCSGLTHYAWQQAGRNIGHGSSNQAGNLPKVPAGAPLQPGDVLFFTRNAGGGGINHVTLHAGDVNGNGTPDMIEAAWYGTPLRIVDNWPANRYFAERFTFAGRPGGN